MATLFVGRLRERPKISSHPCEWDEITRSGVLRGAKPLKQVEPMGQTKRRGKWKCHRSDSSIFLTIWQARGTTCLYHPHHIGRNQYVHLAENTMWEICFECGAKSIFRLSGELFRQTDKRGMMCTAYGGQPRQEDSISSQTATETGFK